MFIIVMYHIKCLIHTLWNLSSRIALQSKLGTGFVSTKNTKIGGLTLDWFRYARITNEIELRRDE